MNKERLHDALWLLDTAIWAMKDQEVQLARVNNWKPSLGSIQDIESILVPKVHSLLESAEDLPSKERAKAALDICLRALQESEDVYDSNKALLRVHMEAAEKSFVPTLFPLGERTLFELSLRAVSLLLNRCTPFFITHYSEGEETRVQFAQALLWVARSCLYEEDCLSKAESREQAVLTLFDRVAEKFQMPLALIRSNGEFERQVDNVTFSLLLQERRSREVFLRVKPSIAKRLQEMLDADDPSAHIEGVDTWLRCLQTTGWEAIEHQEFERWRKGEQDAGVNCKSKRDALELIVSALREAVSDVESLPVKTTELVSRSLLAIEL